MRVLVTGGTGYLGSAIVPALLDACHTPRLLVRRTAAPPHVESVPGDVTNAASLDRALDGCDAVIHAAACVTRVARTRGVHERVNVHGTQAVLAAARARSVRVVVTSSFLALGPSRPGEAPDAGGPFADPPRPVTAYAATKRRALELVRAAMREGADVAVVAPGALYGPGPDREANYIGAIVRRLLRRRLPALPGGGLTRLTWSWVHDVARAHVAALAAGGRDVYIAGGPVATVRDAVAIVARLAGVPAPRTSIPLGVLEPAGAVLEFLGHLTGAMPEFTRAEVAAYRADWAYRSDRAIAELGYSITPLEEGMRALLRAEGALA